MRWNSFFAAILIALLFLFGGCASKFEQALDDVRSAEEAERRFGTPTKMEELEDGGTRRVWQMQTEGYSRGGGGDSSYHVGVGYWGGVGVWLSTALWPEDSYSSKYCRLEIVTNEEGTVTRKNWQGNGCERLLRGQ